MYWTVDDCTLDDWSVRVDDCAGEIWSVDDCALDDWPVDDCAWDDWPEDDCAWDNWLVDDCGWDGWPEDDWPVDDRHSTRTMLGMTDLETIVPGMTDLWVIWWFSRKWLCYTVTDCAWDGDDLA